MLWLEGLQRSRRWRFNHMRKQQMHLHWGIPPKLKCNRLQSWCTWWILSFLSGAVESLWKMIFQISTMRARRIAIVKWVSPFAIKRAKSARAKAATIPKLMPACLVRLSKFCWNIFMRTPQGHANLSGKATMRKCHFVWKDTKTVFPFIMKELAVRALN